MKKIGFALVVMLLALLCASTWASAAFVEEDDGGYEEKHPIDLELERRLDADPSTAGMMEAYKQTTNDWDKLLNENYKALMQKLSKEQQDKLRSSQREWIKYRDLELAFRASFYGGFDGTIYLMAPGMFQCSFVRDRALSLGYLLEDLENR